MTDRRKKVVIIGGGITGLSAAYYLQKKIKDHQLPIDLQLIEATHRLGGKIQTVKRDGYLFEKGPDSFLARKLAATKLAKEVGIGRELVGNEKGKSYILVKDTPHALPDGAVMGIPTKLSPFITTGLFSPVGKLRAAADFFIPKTKNQDDRSLGVFFRRRFGDEVVENLIEPLLSGIYAGDVDRLSLRSTFPQFLHAEHKYRSLIVGMKKLKEIHPQHGDDSEFKKNSVFLTLKEGLQSLVDGVEKAIDPDSITKGIKVEKIYKEDTTYELSLNSGKVIKADSVIVTSPHAAAQSMLSEYKIFEPLKHMPSTSVATVVIAFAQEALQDNLDAMNIAVSRNSDYTITACTWLNKKWPHAVPEGKVLLRCLVGRTGDEAVVDQPDDEIFKIVLEDLKKLITISAEPEFYAVTRWKQSMPQYTVGHHDMLDTMNEQLEKELAGLYVAGSSYEGLGIPECVEQGEDVAKKAVKYVQQL
ncbi:protoporphyrinogen oxidase [Priestia megaterium]|uniref:protoporphyrinogen oxidase n=1 Tax=Priestia megaterium TaxID=1404 RepID=UPI002E209113|nr:protoporphyrinogen oxidase [Priestia megaterium]MED4290988.1 protoporphyrinogen oxidase [Priestia megaterium]MED4297139.1 protoporphyrinogen oxidase [Priestia megaterium]